MFSFKFLAPFYDNIKKIAMIREKERHQVFLYFNFLLIFVPQAMIKLFGAIPKAFFQSMLTHYGMRVKNRDLPRDLAYLEMGIIHKIQQYYNSISH